MPEEEGVVSQLEGKTSIEVAESVLLDSSAEAVHESLVLTSDVGVEKSLESIQRVEESFEGRGDDQLLSEGGSGGEEQGVVGNTGPLEEVQGCSSEESLSEKSCVEKFSESSERVIWDIESVLEGSEGLTDSEKSLESTENSKSEGVITDKVPVGGSLVESLLQGNILFILSFVF